MKIWTGIFCLRLSIVLVVGILTVGCSSTPSGSRPADKEEIEPEVSLKDDRSAIAELRKEVPEEIRKTNDRLSATLNRWRAQKKSPEELREKYDDEIRKLRADLDKRQRRKREDFQRRLGDSRKEFQGKQKDEREDYFGGKPSREARTAFMDRQSVDRDRFQSDQRDARNDFEEALKDERKTFEGDMTERRTEFRQEYPEYLRNYKEMKLAEEKAREEEKANPKPYAGWPYKTDGEGATAGFGAGGGASSGAGDGYGPGHVKPRSTPDPTMVDVNKGQEGWPTTDSSEFEKMGK